VDYKTSSPRVGETEADFLARESSAYREQLAAYREAVAALGPEPVRCALYFTALGRLHELQAAELEA
jgi:ATP-dependent exoDNAse (exonuclease V) beta subunit